MKTLILALIALFAFNLFAEDSLQVQTKEQLQKRERIQNQDKIHLNDTEETNHDVFIDKNSDGIADDRNFQERNHNWHRNRQLSGKVFRSGSCHEWQKGHGNQGGQGHGSGNGGGNRG